MPPNPWGLQGLVSPLVQSWRQGGNERERGGEELKEGETLLPRARYHTDARQLGKRRASPADRSCRVPAASISSHCSSASPSCGIPTLPWKQGISQQLAVVLPAVGAEARARSTALPSLCPQPCLCCSPLSPSPGAGVGWLPGPFSSLKAGPALGALCPPCAPRCGCPHSEDGEQRAQDKGKVSNDQIFIPAVN